MNAAATRYVVSKGARGWIVLCYDPKDLSPAMVGGYFRTKAEAAEYAKTRRGGWRDDR